MAQHAKSFILLTHTVDAAAMRIAIGSVFRIFNALIQYSVRLSIDESLSMLQDLIGTVAMISIHMYM